MLRSQHVACLGSEALSRIIRQTKAACGWHVHVSRSWFETVVLLDLKHVVKEYVVARE